MLNFLIRKDVRKILKRKDSDAGEKGKCCPLSFFVFCFLVLILWVFFFFFGLLGFLGFVILQCSFMGRAIVVPFSDL